MKLKEWRESRNISQADFADQLAAFATKESQTQTRLPQRTVGSWEQGHTPRKIWRKFIALFTKNKVTANDWD